MLSRFAVLEEPKATLQGITENISSGGVCFLIGQGLPVNSIVRCELTVGDLPVNIPTLMQVRWLRKIEGGNNYKVGLQFLL